jgi:hypothetical protein
VAYRGATHTRFAHSLGALKVVQDLVDIVVDERSGRDPAPDLFGQWEGELGERPGRVTTFTAKAKRSGYTGAAVRLKRRR